MKQECNMASDVVKTCLHCGAKNRIPEQKPNAKAKCGRCHHPLPYDVGAATRNFTLRCGQCKAKNRVPETKLHAGAKCGRCGAELAHQNILSGHPLMITDANFEQTVLQSPLPVLLYGWAPWCSVCSGVNGQVDQLASETRGKIRVGKLNIDTNPGLAAKYHILSVPTFFIFDGGQLKKHLPGAVPKHDLMLKMAAFI
jgi:thioredoxin 2